MSSSKRSPCCSTVWGLEAVRDFDGHVYPLLSVEWVSDELHRRGMRRLSRENRRRLSLVDCVSLEFMRLHAIEDVLGLDRHFEEAGHALLRGTGRVVADGPPPRPCV